MAGLVTKETSRDVNAFIDSIDNDQKKADSKILLRMMEELSQQQAKIWGNEQVPDFLIGFGNYQYQRRGGKEVFEWFKLGFAPRKAKITVYLSLDISLEEQLLAELGKCKWGKGCLYINKLEDINLEVLKQLIGKSIKSK